MADPNRIEDLVYGKPVFIKIVVVDPETGEDMFWQQAGHLVGPGDSVTWTYPPNGKLVELD